MSKVLISFTGRVPREVFLVKKVKGKTNIPKPTLYLRPNSTATVEEEDLAEVKKQLGRDSRFLNVHKVAPDAKPKGKADHKPPADPKGKGEKGKGEKGKGDKPEVKTEKKPKK